MAKEAQPSTAVQNEIKHLEEAKKTHVSHKAKREEAGLAVDAQVTAIAEIDARLAELKTK